MIFNTQDVIVLPGDSLPPNHYTGGWLIEREPMLFQAGVDFAYGAGGPLTKTVLDNLRATIPRTKFDSLRIDTRSHMLMPGWFPCIPGWHCDFMETDEDGQQVANSFDAETHHYMYLSGEPATQFLQQRNIDWPENRCRWGDVSRKIEEGGNSGLRPYQIGTGQLIRFCGNELHRGMPHTGKTGHWRFFFRATSFPEGHKAQGIWTNKIRTQVQVYADSNAGW